MAIHRRSWPLILPDEQQELNVGDASADFAKDRLRVLRLTQDGDIYLGDSGHLSGSITASFGLDGLGARQATDDLPMTRDGAKPDFQTVQLSMRYDQDFSSLPMHLSVAGRAQTSFNSPIAASEQLGMGGMDWLSAFYNGALVSDSGVVMRTELVFPHVLGAGSGGSFGGVASPYVFGAGGFGKLAQPTALEESVTRAAAFGLGIRFGVAEKASPTSALLSLEYAHGVASGGQGNQDRFNVSLVSQF